MKESKLIVCFFYVLFQSFSIISLSQGKQNHKYLNQKPPVIKPEIFAPGIISTKYFEHSAPAFSPDGKTVVWTVIYERGKPSRLLEVHEQNDGWSKPALVPFCDTTADELYPSFSPDGKKLYFSSRRKVPIGYKTSGICIWEVEKNENEWGVPCPFDTTVSVGEEYAHSMTSGGTIYFSLRRQGGRIFDIVKAKKTGNAFEKPEVLPYNINTMQVEDGPFIALDESYLIFESERPDGLGQNDLYISFRRKDYSWGMPKNMGKKVNSKFSERFPRVSPDGKYLFFGSDRAAAPGAPGDIYWISTQVIDELKQQDEMEKSINDDGKDVVQAFYNNDYRKVSELLKTWLLVHPKDINGYKEYFYALRSIRKYDEAEVAISKMQSTISENSDIKMELILIKYAVAKSSEAEKIIKTMSQEDSENRVRFISMATTLYDMRKYYECAKMYQLALNVQSEGIDFYNMACALAMYGDKDEAFEALMKAVNHNFNSKRQFDSDTDLELLKSDPRWKEIIKNLKN